MSSGMNVERAKELASKKDYKWAVGNIKSGKGIAYRKATMILLRELAEIADRLVLCKDCKHINKSQCVTHLDGTERRYKCNCIDGYMLEHDFCSYGERIDNE